MREGMSHRPLGPYIIEQRLALGGMAEVYIARKTGPHGFAKRVALKRILPQHAGDPDFVAMFIDEARLAARLEHPNIVQVFDFGEHRGELFLAMELVVGSNINRLLRALTSRKQVLPLDLALHVVSQTAHALAYAHRLKAQDGALLGVVHRDVSPANILLTHTGHVKLGDFGIARVSDRASRTDDGQVRGKLGYMSPEQVTGRALDGRSDVFTLATVLTEMLIGEPLFGTGNDLDVLLRIRDGDLAPLEGTTRQIPSEVERVLRLGLETSPRARPNAASFAASVDDVIRKRGVVRGPDRLARLLMRLNLVRGAAEDAPGAQGTPAVEPPSDSGRISTLGPSHGSGTTAKLEEPQSATPSFYRIRRDSGEEIGPVPFPRLAQLMATGNIDEVSMVAKQEGDYVPAGSLPELARFVSSPALRWTDPPSRQATRRGGLQSVQLLRVVHSIGTQRETGLLHLSDADRRKKIYFIEGRPEFVGSNDKNELLGEYLVRKGVCLRMEVDMALALLPRYDGRLGDALVGLGILRPVQLFRAISHQVRSRYLEAFRWRRGAWAYLPGERSGEETIPFDTDGAQLLRDAAMEAHPAELEAALEPFRERVLRPARSAPRPLASYRVPAEWEHVVDLSDRTTFGGLLAKCVKDGLEPDDVYRAMVLALSCELVEAA